MNKKIYFILFYFCSLVSWSINIVILFYRNIYFILTETVKLTNFHWFVLDTVCSVPQTVDIGSRRSVRWSWNNDFRPQKLTLPSEDNYQCIKPTTDARETRTKTSHQNSHEKLARNRTRSIWCEKYLAVSRYDTRTSFSRELTRTRVSRLSFLYVCHGLND